MRPHPGLQARPALPGLTADELARTVATYDPSKHEASLVLGHPSTDGPAHGWVGSLDLSEDGLLAAEAPRVIDALKAASRRADTARCRRASTSRTPP